MHRVIVSMVTFAFLVGGCGQADGGSPNPAADVEFYSLFFNEVLERGEKWWGYPPLADYCVAITLSRMEPSLEESRDPGQEVLDSLGQANPDKTFHPASTCRGGYPFETSTGEVAGLLWVAPVDATNRVTLSGGWTAQRDMTEWGCSFVEREGVVELEECVLHSET